jgi:hypothetical protein
VEHVGLHLLHFTLAGLILAMVFPVLESTTVVNRAGKRKYGKGTRVAMMPAPVIIGALIVWVLISGFVSLRPIRGATGSFNGVQAATQFNDIQTGIGHMDNAISAAPWEGLWRVQRAEMKSFLAESDPSQFEGAYQDAVEAVRKLRYKPGSAVPLAQIMSRYAQFLVNSGQLDDGIAIYEESLDVVRRGAANDPLAPQVQANTANFITGVAQVYTQLDDESRARELIAEAFSYDAENAAATELLNSLDNPPPPVEDEEGSEE